MNLVEAPDHAGPAAPPHAPERLRTLLASDLQYKIRIYTYLYYLYTYYCTTIHEMARFGIQGAIRSILIYIYINAASRAR
jgi:hypothetical protein